MREDTVAKGREDGTQITLLSFTCSHRDGRVSARMETSHKRPCGKKCPNQGGDLEARDLDAKNGWSGQGVASSVRAEATEAVADVTPTLRHTVSFIC